MWEHTPQQDGDKGSQGLLGNTSGFGPSRWPRGTKDAQEGGEEQVTWNCSLRLAPMKG